MREISSRPSSNGNGNFSNENRVADSAANWREKPEHKEIIAVIKAANAKVSLASVLSYYNVKVYKSHGNWGKPVICPFLHSGSIERTPSFGYNFTEGRFYCFGCKRHGRAVEFIAYKENRDKYGVAKTILGDSISDINCEDYVDDAVEIENIMFFFSKFCNKLVQKNKNNPAAIEEIRKVQWFVDCYINSKAPSGKLDKESLEWVLEKARELLA